MVKGKLNLYSQTEVNFVLQKFQLLVNNLLNKFISAVSRFYSIIYKRSSHNYISFGGCTIDPILFRNYVANLTREEINSIANSILIIHIVVL